MTDIEAHGIARENDYLKRRCAQLQRDVGDLQCQVLRMQQQLERMSAFGAAQRAEPLIGG